MGSDGRARWRRQIRPLSVERGDYRGRSLHAWQAISQGIAGRSGWRQSAATELCHACRAQGAGPKPCCSRTCSSSAAWSDRRRQAGRRRHRSLYCRRWSRRADCRTHRDRAKLPSRRWPMPTAPSAAAERLLRQRIWTGRGYALAKTRKNSLGTRLARRATEREHITLRRNRRDVSSGSGRTSASRGIARPR